MKRFVFAAIALSLVLVFSQTFSAQATVQPTAEKSLKTLKKALTKNSRYGNEVIYWFNPISFKGCEVSYRFGRLNENVSERFDIAQIDRMSPLKRENTVRERDLQGTQTQTQQNSSRQQVPNNSGNQITARANVFYNNTFPYYSYGMDRRIFFLEQVVTLVDLSEIDASSVKVVKNPNGSEYVTFNALKDKQAIAKRMNGYEAETIEVETDFIPVISEKSGNKISAAFVEAVNACRE